MAGGRWRDIRGFRGLEIPWLVHAGTADTMLQAKRIRDAPVMNLKNSFVLGLFLLGCVVLNGCVGNRPNASGELQRGESIVLAGEEPGTLAFAPLLSQSFKLRSTYREALPQTIHYEPRRDYVVEGTGQIRRTPGSRIPDFSTNMLYGKEDFSHDRFPGFGNLAFIAYAEYFHREKWKVPPPNHGLSAKRLPSTREKLRAGKSVRIIAFGDSITAGGDASEPALIFWERWADSLRRKYPRAAIESINGATGGTPPPKACSGCRPR